ncbi:LuxR C-terminal-related transcriptional regulator [Novosphingobium sp. MMS21-SN21R]|uniref:LuxR C-terminal-related transcriptional regulator n=1 Tax=Novosphingobium sp. MMS21-SN21R TaxID=2969298 RepID=UPI002887DBFA|nr:LuxR C-terminal-related transcriptional regulator [Novosphingobium sp. MMS21-SN21R]MDT0507014.1 LuxR C-terminal-related transcriptional regulator [Novosphingobium sp. MMS21-SN21R]
MTDSLRFRDPALLLKTIPPRVARDLLERDRLGLSRLSGSAGQFITVVAPTGFGKTSQLAQWRKEALATGSLVFWLTLDGRDEPLRLVNGLAQSANQASGRFGFDTPFIATLERFSDPLEAMTAWLAEAARISRDILLVIDEADRAPEATRTEALSYLAGNAPANLRIAIGARPTERIGFDGNLVNAPYTRIAADDLRFKPGETISMLASALGKAHDVEVALRLHELIEGWPLGVQLAIASLRRNDDLSGFLSAATADIRRFFIDRLIDRQPDAAKQLLIRISQLDMVHPELCVAICDGADIRDDLRKLQEQTPLLSQAEEGEWMRLHPMAREVLDDRYRRIAETERRAMSARASEWLSNAGLFEAAAEQALAAGMAERAYDLAEGVVQQMLIAGRIGAVLEWHQRLPVEDFLRHPGFWMPAAWALAMSERHAEARPLLDRIEAQPTLQIEDKFEASLIRSTIAGFADSGDELNDELRHWTEPPSGARPQDVPIYWVSRGLASLHAGKPDQSRLDWMRFEGFDQSDVYTPMTLGFGSYGIALSHLWEGRCALAEQVLRPALTKAEAQMGRRNLVTCMLAALLARARWDGGSHDEPASLLALRLDVLERQGLPDALLNAYLTLARMAASESRHDKAFSLLEELRALGVTRSMPRLHFAAQCEMVRQHAKAGRGETAGALVRQLEATFVSQQSQFPKAFLSWLELQLELAKVHAALAHQGSDHMVDALHDVERATVLASALNLGWEAVEARLLRSLVLERSGYAAAAAEIRTEALSLAEINGQFRLSTQYGGVGRTGLIGQPGPVVEPTMESVSGAAILTIKEREILGLLAQNLSNKEIAIALDLSEQTVKWHLKNLFLKLDGANRKHTVARARMLGLIAA